MKTRCLSLTVGLAMSAGLAMAQKPMVRVEFRVRDSVTAQAFTQGDLRALERAASALMADALSRRYRFLDLSADTNRSRDRVLIAELDRQDRASHGPVVDVGLHMALVEPSRPDTARAYWITLRPLDAGFPDLQSVDAFIGVLALKLDEMVDAQWQQLVDDVLGLIPIADSNATVWGPPGPTARVEWLIPYTRDSLCLDPEEGRLRVRNVHEDPLGPEDFTVVVQPRGVFDPDSSIAVPGRLERFRRRVRARPMEAVSVPDSLIEVKAVYVKEYHFDRVNCTTLRRPGQGGAP